MNLITPRSRCERYTPHLAVALAGTVLLAGLAGCADTRISLEDLARLEAEVATITPVALETTELALTELRPYTVGPGDVLNVVLTGLNSQYEQTTLQLRLHDDGTIMLPMVGLVPVAGLDMKGVEKALYNAHVPTHVKDMSVFVQLSRSEPTTVVVVGAAGESGIIRLASNERNVVYALSQAIGFGPMGSGRVRVRPVRPERPEVAYNLTDINDLRRALLAPPLESGDMLVVEPAETSAVFVTGLVNAPSAVPVPQHGSLSLVRTLAAAGGLRDFLAPDEATLWRRMPDGQQVRVKLALAAVMRGAAPDIELHAGDVLDVPHTAKTRILEWCAGNIRIGPFGATSMYDPMADRRARIIGNDSGLWQQQISQSLGAGVSQLLIPPP